MSDDQSSEAVATDGRDPGPVDPWTDLAAFVALPQLTGLVLGPDGRRLVAVVSQPGPDNEPLESLWLIDPDGLTEPARLTRSAGASAPAFLPDGSLLYLSARTDPEDVGHNGSGRDGPPVSAVWRLAANGGEPERIATSPGGITGLEVARQAGTVTIAAPSLASGEVTDDRRRSVRKERKVSAILHEGARVRSWDHDLRPDAPRLLVRPDERDEPMRDLAPDAGRALTEASWTISDDGAWIVTEWQTPLAGGRQTHDLAVIDVASGAHRILVGDPDAAVAWSGPVASPDGRRIACIREVVGSPEHIPDVRIEVIDVASGDRRTVDTGVVWPHELAWSPTGDALFVAGDGEGHHPLLRIDLDDGAVTRLTAGSYHSPCPAPDGTGLFAIASAVDRPPRPVRLTQRGADQKPVDLRGPATPGAPGRLEEVRTTAADGTELRAWLVLPPDASPASPAPLLLWVHGGPLSSWNDWHWRWCPHVMIARGWAVLLPDPALSTGYGDEMIRRGWNQWGGAPYEDVMALTDAAVARPDLDSSRTAMMGGSYGGYMANWIAGHTDRFKAIVSHASVYNLLSFQTVTDYPDLWIAEWDTPERNPDLYREWSPHHHVDAIRTPMLLIHGNRDYRCPVAESIALWTELRRRDVESQFLYFPDEGHWVVKPGNRMAWYQAVFAWLDHHVLGKDWVRPELL